MTKISLRRGILAQFGYLRACQNNPRNFAPKRPETPICDPFDDADLSGKIAHIVRLGFHVEFKEVVTPTSRLYFCDITYLDGNFRGIVGNGWGDTILTAISNAYTDMETEASR